jgi:hypothetical protein
VFINSRPFAFDRSFLASASRRVSALLLCNPLAGSLSINDARVTADSVAHLSSRSRDLSSSEVVTVATLAIRLQSDPLFDYAVRSQALLSLDAPTRWSLL